MSTPERDAWRLKEARLAKAKLRNDELAIFLRSGAVDDLMSRRQVNSCIKALRLCASQVVLREYWLEEKPDCRLAHGSDFCHRYRFCPLCAGLRAAREAMICREVVARATASRAGAGFLSMLVFTIRNRENFHEAFEIVRSAIAELIKRRRRALSGSRDVTEFAKLYGGVYSIELKRGAGSGLWHVHVHMLAYQREWLDRDALSAEWARLVNQDRALVFIKEVEERDFAEIFKYHIKFGDMSFRDNVVAAMGTFHRQLLAAFGDLQGDKNAIGRDLTEALRGDGASYIDYLLSWKWRTGYWLVDFREGVENVEGGSNWGQSQDGITLGDGLNAFWREVVRRRRHSPERREAPGLVVGADVARERQEMVRALETRLPEPS